MYYLGEHMQHATTVFPHEQCLILPSMTDGPAIVVMDPYAPIGHALAQAYGALLLTRSPRLGGEPFTIYELPAAPSSATIKSQAFNQNLQAANKKQLRSFKDHTNSWVISDWQQLQSREASYNTTYSYHFLVTSPTINNLKIDPTCTFSTVNTGDHILTPLQLPANKPLPQSLTIGITTYKETPENPTFGPFLLETHRRLKSPEVRLQTVDRKNTISVAIS